MSDRLRVSEATGLLTFLNTQLKGWTRNKIKQRLKAGCVFVNSQPIMQYDHELKVGDDVEVRAAAKNMHGGTSRLEILYSDNDLIAVNKPAGLLSVASAGENKNHALAILRNQLSRPKRPVKLWPVHRLDRDTSGSCCLPPLARCAKQLMRDGPVPRKSILWWLKVAPIQVKGPLTSP